MAKDININVSAVGASILNSADPSAVSWIRVNTDNTITYRTAAQTLSDLGAETALTFSTGLTRTVNAITIDSTVVTLTGSQALSNKTGLISQWTNDSGYLTSLAGAVTSVTGSGNIASTGGATPNLTFTGVLPTANGGTAVNIATTALTLGTASTNVGSIVLHNATNANTITIQSGVTSSSHTLTLPVANASGVLTNNGSGTLTWAASSSGITIGSTTITSGTDRRILFQDATASDFVTQLANFTMGSVATGVLDVPTGYAIAGTKVIQQDGTQSLSVGSTAGVPGHNHVYVGYGAGATPQTGRGATFIGYRAGFSGITGQDNISIGAASNYNGGTFSYSLFIGSSSSSASGMSNTASNQAVIGMPLGNGYTQFYFGQGVSAVTGTPSGVTFNATPGTTAGGAFTILGGAGSGTDKAGGDNTSGGGTGTGAGVPGKYIIKTATTLGTGATVQSYVSRLTISGGAVTTDASTATWADALDFVLGTTTGTKIGTGTTQKIGFWNATPLAQQTTASAASTFVANTSLIANDTATFDGYTLGQVVKILRNLGILA